MKKNILKFIALSLVVTSFTSCLKDNSLVLDPAKGHNVIEFANPGQIVTNGTPHPLYSFSYQSTATPSLPITVSYSGPEATAPQDITVKFGVADTSTIGEYNRATDGGYVPLNAAAFTLSANEVVIKAGTSKATFNVLLKPSAFNFNKSEVLGLTITSASPGIVSGNFNTILLNVSAKNQYDGQYTITATAPMTDATNPALKGFYPMDKMSLITTGPNSVAMYDSHPYFSANFYHPIANGSAVSAYGSFSPIFTMDASGNVISVTNYYGQPASNGRSGKINPSGVNKFTVSGTTKTLEVSYYMLQPGTTIRTSFYEKWVFTGNRP
ncbi:hypothetical protein ACVWYG_003227 [Pedobacter sp. UYEF25]